VKETLVSKLGSDQDVLWAHDGPEERGHGVKRKRLFDAGVNLRTMRFVGPKNYKDDFAARFAATRGKRA